MTAATLPQDEKTIYGLDQFGRKAVIKDFIIVIFHLLILTISSGRMDWLNAWVYLGFMLVFNYILRLYVAVAYFSLLHVRECVD